MNCSLAVPDCVCVCVCVHGCMYTQGWAKAGLHSCMWKTIQSLINTNTRINCVSHTHHCKPILAYPCISYLSENMEILAVLGLSRGIEPIVDILRYGGEMVDISSMCGLL